MELLSVFRADNQRPYLTQLLPGMAALWPFLLLVLDYLEIRPDPSLEWNWFILIGIYAIASMGLGVLIEDLGTLVELRLEGVYFYLKSHSKGPYKSGNLDRNPLSIRTMLTSLLRHLSAPIPIILFQRTWRWYLGCHLNEKVSSTKEEAKKEFDENWSRYLELTFDNAREPVALRYYRSVLVRFKFQINMALAILIMLFGHLLFQWCTLDLQPFLKMFVNPRTWLYLTFAYMTVSVLIVEGFKMIELLDEVRGRLVRIGRISKLSNP